MHRRVLASIAMLLTAAAASAAPPAPPATYGEIDVAIESIPPGTSKHGYLESWFRVVNRSPSRSHSVRLTMPRESFLNRAGNHLQSVTRLVQVEPGKSVRVALAFPEQLGINGSDLSVAIDGREQERGLALFLGGSHRGYGSVYGSDSPLVLVSRAVNPLFSRRAQDAENGRAPGVIRSFNLFQADQDCNVWSPNWLGYSRYDGVVVTADDLRGMPAEARSALGRYVECGGSLFVLGDPGRLLPLPAKSARVKAGRLSSLACGFGRCLIAKNPDVEELRPVDLQPVLDSWVESSMPWQFVKSASAANQQFPVIDGIETPSRGLLLLMFLFVLIIGPINMTILARRKRKLWLFWTVPLLSFLTCGFLLGYMALTEGWQGHSRVEGFTYLDENSGRASTIGWMGFYSPLSPRGGLHLSADTEAAFQNGSDSNYSYRHRQSGSALSLDWTDDQHLASGWVVPRVPAHFRVRKSERRHERVVIFRGDDDRLEAVNGLGADITQFWYADEKGNLHRAEAIPAGKRAALQAAAKPASPATTLRKIYSTGNWQSVIDQGPTQDLNLLKPRTYLAVLDGAPFLEEGLSGSNRRARSIVFGILKEGDDGR